MGYGGSPFGPFWFTIPEEALNDLGFLKLFLSTSPVNMDSIVQSSPFGEFGADHERTSNDGFHTRRVRANSKQTDGEWSTLCYTVDIREHSD